MKPLIKNAALCDLFENPELLPKHVQKILNDAGDIETYDQCEALQNKLNAVGFEFDYYLDAVPHSLRKINP